MRVRHLNCATMCPRFGGSFISGRAGEKAELVAHVLVCETNDGLALVDTGFGLDDCASPKTRFGPFVGLLGARFDPSETALRQIEAMGYGARDVRHIVVTHLDLDHAGGIPDFPEATVHVMMEEHDAAMQRQTFFERARYCPAHFAHGPKWKVHRVEGEHWNGFESVRAISGDEILIIPMHGHTRGHSAVAVKTDEGWILHAGDAYFHADEMRGKSAPMFLEAFQRIIAVDDEKRRHNRRRLRELARTAHDVKVFCAHSKEELLAFSKGSGGAATPTLAGKAPKAPFPRGAS
jgi:glyoxylase-like metal-dependent hydrolase (beta-lactamase superfamily II)